ncbi:helix-turn-helix domain-containing protein [Maricaulis parjimensis]|uniref:helix-turn-helix domain-containing protein n=1 Tax=Maricaulis parjimensis TaxID=144023 RepID=UPI001939EA2B|nr:2TM domain-containing protein [Maricaulis parjimensis]
MSICERRTERGWSQEDLALHTGLSPRTIQRIEAGRKPSLESLKALASVFETSVSELMKDDTMTTTTQTAAAPDAVPAELHIAEKEAIAYVQNLKAFHLHWISFLFVMPALYGINSLVSPDVPWWSWAGLAWGAALVFHAVIIFGLFGLFGTDWERREFHRRMGSGR